MVRQSDAENFFVKRLGFTPRTTDPIDTNDGDMWYRSDLAELRYNKNGVVVDLLSGSGSSDVVKYITADIDLTVLGTVNLFTTENNGKNFYVTGCFLNVTEAVGHINDQATLTVGVNNPTYDSVSGSSLTGISSDLTGVSVTTPPSNIVLPNTLVKANIIAVDDGTSVKGKLTVIGFYA